MSKRNNNSFTINEKKAIFSLAGIFSLRMFGLFMLLPILSIYANGLEGTTPMLTGIALGAYGLTQALLQIPFGILADRLDRKKVIAAGLLIFSVGSIVAGLSDSIIGLIIGRAIQGAGAISAAILALTADLTRSDQRTKAMALIGISIGFTFMLALISAPPLQARTGVDGLFFLISLMALIAIAILFRWVPNVLQKPIPQYASSDSIRLQLFDAVSNPHLLQLNIGILISHMMLTGLFLIIPSAIVSDGGYSLDQHWKIYIPVLLLSAVGMAPLIKGASHPHYVLLVLRLAIGTVLIAFIILTFSQNAAFFWVIIGLILFFAGFNALEAILPSLTSQQVSSQSRATVMAVYNTCQFFGVFLGGLIGGWLLGRGGQSAVMMFSVTVALIWLILTLILPKFKVIRSISIELGHLNVSQREALVDKICKLNGIKDISIVGGETVAYLEVDDRLYSDAELQQLIKT